MRRTRSLGLVAALLALTVTAACSAGDDDEPGGPDGEQGAVVTRDPSRQGPAPDVDGARSGGTLTVHLPGDPGPETLDPTAGWEGSGRAIQQALTHRSLTQYARGRDGRPILVPDLAVDLGRPNDDFTEWRFTIRDDATWEDGKLITPREVAFGIERSLDTGAFPLGPGGEYSVRYFAGAEKYAGPYSSKGKGKGQGKGEDGAKEFKGVSVDGSDVVIKMSEPFPDMDHWGAFMAMGPAPEGKASTPPAYGRDPLSNGPYKVESFTPRQELVLVRNEQWNPDSDPARHQYVDKWVFRFGQDQAEVDRLMLSRGPDSQSAVATSLGPDAYGDAVTALGDRLVHQATPCLSTLTPDYGKVSEREVRQALAHAYPYEDAWLAAGEVPGASRVHADSLLPLWTAGRRGWTPEGGPVRTDPARSKELLAEAGYEPGEYELTMIFYGPDPLARDVQAEVTRGLTAGGFKVRAIPVDESPYNVWADPEDKTNNRLNVRGLTLCADWPTGSAMLPQLLAKGSVYNTARFDERSVDREMDRIATLPLDEQADAWGALDERVMADYLPVVPLDQRNQLLAFGEKVGNPSGDASVGAPNYKDLFVVE